MAFAIMRTAKLKTAGSIAGSIKHTYREIETPNADIERTKDNEVIVEYDEEKCRRDIESGRTRSDNVEVVEYVFTTSPEWMDEATPEDKKKFEEKTKEFLKEEHGEENIQSLVWHKDEQTDHISAHVTPRDEDGKLNAKRWLGGKEKLRELQDRFWEKVKDLGLERGQRGSKAKHQEVSKYYGRVEQAESLTKEKEMPKLTLPRTPDDAVTGLYKQAEVKAHGLKVAHSIRDQMLEREKSFTAKVTELENKVVASRGNITKNQTLEGELKRLKPFEKFHKDLKELSEMNPEINKVIGATIKIKRERDQNTWMQKPPEERLREVDKQLMKEHNPKKREDLVAKRMAATKEIGENRKQLQLSLGKSRDNDRGR